MKTKTVCLKLTSGEDIFAELIDDDKLLDQNFVKLYQPYEARVMNMDGRMNMMLSPWQVFTDDLTYIIQADHVMSINSLDKHHTQIYGAMVMNTELKIIQQELSYEAKLRTLTKDQIDNSLKETLAVVMNAGAKYFVPMPELDQVKTDFYSFLMAQYEEELPVTH